MTRPPSEPANSPVELSEGVLAKAAELGEIGQQWLADLPGLLGRLRDEGYTLTGALLDGTSGLVQRAIGPDGRPCVVKAPLPFPDEHEVDILAAGDGRGYARLLHRREDWFVMEQLGPSVQSTERDVLRQADACISALVDAWTVPQVPGAGDGRWRAESLADFITEHRALGPDRVVEVALELCAERACDDVAPVLCHADPHPGNVLADPAGGFKLVDPSGAWMDPAYDLGVIWRSWNAPLLQASDARALANRWVEHLAARSGVAAERIWQWGFIERVSSGLYLSLLGLDDQGHLAAADRLAVGR